METRVCIECGQKLFGRIDKKFCSDQCRSTYFNRRRAAEDAMIKDINRILRRNRNILHDLNPDGKTTISPKKLQALGFNFDYYTNVYRTKNEKTVYYFCYDYGYLKKNNGLITIVRRKSYV